MKKNILILAANPKNTSRLRLDQEVRDISEGLKRSQHRDEFTLTQQWATRPIDVRRAILDYKPNIVHFCGHGAGEKGIVLEDENGYAQTVSAEVLSEFFELFAEKIDCVVLNACYSEVQAKAISAHIKYVIGMKDQIGDEAAIEFSVAFYDALGAGESIEFAHKLACNAVRWRGLSDNLIPTLEKKTDFTKPNEVKNSANTDLQRTGKDSVGTTDQPRLVVFTREKQERKEQIEKPPVPFIVQGPQPFSPFIERAVFIAQKTNQYESTIELIDLFKTDKTLTREAKSYLLLKEAILFQQNGDLSRAQNTLKAYELLAGSERSVEYYICKGKLLSQITKNPDKLTRYIDTIRKKDIFRNVDNRQALSSLYWRSSVLWQMYDRRKSEFYLSIHRDLVEIGSYQIPHNFQLIGLSKTIDLSGDSTKPNGSDLSKSIDALVHSFNEYNNIENFQWLDKCVISNLLMLALVDHLGKRPLSYYRKLFFVRKLFALHNITPNDEAISEIFFVIKKMFPEAYQVIFTRDIARFIQTHTLGDILRELYLEVEKEYTERFDVDKIDVVTLYKDLVF